jgi:hypothetical protein
MEASDHAGRLWLQLRVSSWLFLNMSNSLSSIKRLALHQIWGWVMVTAFVLILL